MSYRRGRVKYWFNGCVCLPQAIMQNWKRGREDRPGVGLKTARIEGIEDNPGWRVKPPELKPFALVKQCPAR